MILKVEYRDIDSVNLPKEEMNPKQHDLESLIKSFTRYGFKDAPVYDDTLDCVVAGTGRVLALRKMKERGALPPKGIIAKKGKWHAPFQTGMGARSVEEGKAFIFDHNNIVLLGGSFNQYEIAEIWTEEYVKNLAELAKQGNFPVSVDGDDIDILLLRQKDMVPARESSAQDDDEEADTVTVTLPDIAMLRDFTKKLYVLIGDNPQWDIYSVT